MDISGVNEQDSVEVTVQVNSVHMSEEEDEDIIENGETHFISNQSDKTLNNNGSSVESEKSTRKTSTKWSKYSKKFKVEWLHDPDLAEWVVRDADDTKAVCRFCNTHLRAHKSDLKKHMSSFKHKKSMSRPISVVKKAIAPQELNIDPLQEKIIRHEITLAAYAGCHSAGNSVTHLTELCNHFIDLKQKVILSPTKCAAIIKNIISPHLLKELVKDLKNVKYTLILDESTNIPCRKYLCVCIRYYSKYRGKIRSVFLGLISLKSDTSFSVYKQLKTFLFDNDIELSMCLAIALDGSSSLIGSKNSLYTLLKKDAPDVYLIKCIPHSLQLACSIAGGKLPKHIDYMIRETFNWFQRSSMIEDGYNILYKAITDCEEILHLIPLAGNRWLCRSQSVKRILEQYDQLKLHFSKNMHHDKYLSEQLCSMYSDLKNKIYLVFLKPILQEFEKMNSLFQEENTDFCNILSDLEKFAIKMFHRVISAEHVTLSVNLASDAIYLPLDKIDYGYEFLSMLMDLTNRQEISMETAMDIRENCFVFLKEICQQLQMRIPENIKVLRKIENLSPTICLSHTRPPFCKLPLELADENKLSSIESEWQQLLYIDWSLHFEVVPKDGQTFWCKAATAHDEDGNYVLQDLSEFALNVYSLPVSNAEIEKIFSKASAIKTKLRDRLDIELLEALLRIKSSLSGDRECCFSLEPSEAMVNEMYLNPVENDSASQDCLDTMNTFSFEANYHLHL